MSKRVRLDGGVRKPAPIEIVVNGEPCAAYPGEALATALLAAGHSVFRRTAWGVAHSPVCNMGACFECLVAVEGMGMVRSCMVTVTPGMRIDLPGVGQ